MYYFESFGEYSLELEGNVEEILRILSNKRSIKDDKLQESTLKPANKCVNDDSLPKINLLPRIPIENLTEPTIDDMILHQNRLRSFCTRSKYNENIVPDSKQFPRYTVKNDEEIADFTIENKIKVHDVTKSIINAVGKSMMDYK